MKTALLLNATYEPLRVIPITRAIVLVLMQKAEVIAESDEEFHSERKTVPIPSVIRLLVYRENPVHGPCQAHPFRSFQAGQRDLRLLRPGW